MGGKGVRQLSSRSRESRRRARRPRRRKGRLAFAAAGATLLTLTACGTSTDASVGGTDCDYPYGSCFIADNEAQFFDRPGHLSPSAFSYTRKTVTLDDGDQIVAWPTAWNGDTSALATLAGDEWHCMWHQNCVKASASYSQPAPLPDETVGIDVFTPGLAASESGSITTADSNYTRSYLMNKDSSTWHINNRPVNVVVKPWESTPTPEMPTVARVDVINKDVKGAVTAIVDPNAQGEDVDGTQRFGFYQPVESAKAGTTGITITWEDGTYGTNYARIAMDSDTGQLDASAGCPGGQKISCHVLIDQAGLGEGPITITVQPQLT